MYSTFQNGRVTLNNEYIKDMNMIDKTGERMNNFQVESLYGIQETSQLNQLFFSKKNMENIQNMIRYEVWNKTEQKYIIDKQSDIELQIIMRSIYLQHSPNLPNKIKEQIKYLNELVRDWCTEQIIPEIQQYYGYMKEVEYMPMPIDLPLNLSSKGSRTLRSVTTTF
jgi:ATP-dependent RNA circularization protein (DNA/RNA ligase family)